MGMKNTQIKVIEGTLQEANFFLAQGYTVLLYTLGEEPKWLSVREVHNDRDKNANYLTFSYGNDTIVCMALKNRPILAFKAPEITDYVEEDYVRGDGVVLEKVELNTQWFI